MILLSIDPGLHATGFAIFDPAQGMGMRALVSAWEYKTDADQHIAARLAGIRDATHEAVSRCHRLAVVEFITGGRRTVRVLIETPATGGDYGGQVVRRGGVNLLYQALGVIQAATAEQLDHAELDELMAYIRPGRGRKRERHQELRETARIAGVQLPTGKRGGILGNAWDAIDNGVRWLMKEWRG